MVPRFDLHIGEQVLEHAARQLRVEAGRGGTQRRGKLGRVEATRRGDRDQAASHEHAMCLGKCPGGFREVVEDIEQRDRAEGPVREGQRRGLRVGVGSGRPDEHLQRAVHADQRTLRQVPCQLALAAADVEDRRQALGEQATSHPAVHVLAARMAAKDRPCEAEALRVAVVVGRDRPARLPAHLPSPLRLEDLVAGREDLARVELLLGGVQLSECRTEVVAPLVAGTAATR